jgi:hypothetical protein
MVSAGNWYSIKKKSYCDKEITFVIIVKCLLGLRAVNKKKKKKKRLWANFELSKCNIYRLNTLESARWLIFLLKM